MFPKFTKNVVTKINKSEAEFEEFEPRLKYSWFHLKSYSLLQNLSRSLTETGFWRIYDAAQIH